MSKSKNAFSIVELVIVIAVIAILAAVLIPTFSNLFGSAGEAGRLTQIRSAQNEYFTAIVEKEDNYVYGIDGYLYIEQDGKLVKLKQLYEGYGETYVTYSGVTIYAPKKIAEKIGEHTYVLHPYNGEVKKIEMLNWFFEVSSQMNEIQHAKFVVENTDNSFGQILELLDGKEVTTDREVFWAN